MNNIMPVNISKTDSGGSKGVPIVRAVSAFIFLLVTVFGAAVILLVHVSVDRFVSNGLDDFLMRDMLAIREHTMSFLEHRMNILQDYTHSPELIRAATDHDGLENAGKLMDRFSLHGEKYQTCLLDADGGIVSATLKAPIFDYEREEWVGKLAAGKFKRYMGISSFHGQYFWRLATPLTNGARPVGFLAVEIPVSAIDAENNFTLMLTGSHVEFVHDNIVIASFGTPIDGPSESFNLPGVGAVMRYRVDRSGFVGMYKVFIAKLSVFLLVLASLTIAAAIIFGKNFFALPLIETRALSSALAQGATSVKLPTDQRISEMRLLARDFNIMAKKIIQREKSLREAREHLENSIQKKTKELHSEIAGREKAEQSMRRSEERMELALNSANLGMWDWNVATGEMLINRRWAEMLGYSFGEIVPHLDSWKDLIHPDDKQDVMEMLNAHLKGKIPFYVSEHRVGTKTGEWKWILDRAKIVERDGKGNPLWVTGTHMDISYRKRMGEDILRIRKAVEYASDPIVILKNGFKPSFRNAAFTEMFGYTMEDLSSPDDFFSMFADRNDAFRIREKTMNGGFRMREVEIRTKNGEKVVTSVRADAIRDEIQALVGYVVVYSDVAAIKRAKVA